MMWALANIMSTATTEAFTPVTDFDKRWQGDLRTATFALG